MSIKITNKELLFLPLIGRQFDIDSEGRIWRIGLKRRRKDEFSPCARSRAEVSDFGKGYLRLTSRISGNEVACMAHRLVWVVKIGAIPEGLTINHKNGMKDDNRPENMELLTPLDNNLHAINVLNRPSPAGERHANHTLSESDVLGMRERRRGGASIYDLSLAFNVVPGQVSQICSGKAWGHLGGDKIEMDCHAKGEKNHKAKLTGESVVKIRGRHAAGETFASIARDFPLSEVAIGNVIKRRTWKHIP